MPGNDDEETFLVFTWKLTIIRSAFYLAHQQERDISKSKLLGKKENI